MKYSIVALTEGFASISFLIILIFSSCRPLSFGQALSFTLADCNLWIQSEWFHLHMDIASNFPGALHRLLFEILVWNSLGQTDSQAVLFQPQKMGCRRTGWSSSIGGCRPGHARALPGWATTKYWQSRYHLFCGSGWLGAGTTSSRTINNNSY